MKEIWAVIRRNKLPDTKKALEETGSFAMSIHSVEGRGRQGGVIFREIDPYVPEHYEGVVKVKPTPSQYALTHTLTKAVTYVPKRLLVLVVPDEAVRDVLDVLMRVNRTGHPGDGKIFLMAVEDALRLRTGERGMAALR